MTVSVSDVRAIASTEFAALDDDEVQTHIDTAEDLYTGVYSERLGRRSQVRVDPDRFVTYVAAHLAELAQGGEAQSENQGAGSVSYNTVTGQPLQSLSETRYGRVARSMIQQQQNIGATRSY